MIKLIATDMDGTLLNSNNEIQHGFSRKGNNICGSKWKTIL